jgi:hypothetical protein
MPSPVRIVLPALAPTLLAAALAGCGGGDGSGETTVAAEARPASTGATAAPGAPAAGTTGTAASSSGGAPAAVVERYLAAFSKGDGRAVCRLYTAAERGRVAKAAKGSCAAGIEQAFQAGGGPDGFGRSLGALKVGRATVEGSRARVALVSSQGGTGTALTFRLERTGSAWRIARPAGG